MIPEGRSGGQGWRAALAVLALGLTALIIYALFSSGFGRPRPPQVTDTPLAAPPLAVTQPVSRPSGVAAAAREPVLAVVSDRLWLTYLPQGLERSGGGAGAARFGTADRYVEARVEYGAMAANWETYRGRITLLDHRDTTVRGRPAVVGRHPGGGRVIAWLERAGTGAWIRVSESLGDELLAIAASVQAPVGD